MKSNRGTFAGDDIRFQIPPKDQSVTDRYYELRTEISKYRVGIKKFFDGKLSPN